MIKKITPDGDLISIVKSKEIGVQDRLVECTNEQKGFWMVLKAKRCSQYLVGQELQNSFGNGCCKKKNPS